MTEGFADHDDGSCREKDPQHCSRREGTAYRGEWIMGPAQIFGNSLEIASQPTTNQANY